MSGNQPTGDGWTEYRLLVTDMLERHEKAIGQFEKRFFEFKEECRKAINDAVEEIKKANKKEREEAAQVQIAKITSRWEFWGLVFANLTSIIIALIALLKP